MKFLRALIFLAMFLVLVFGDGNPDLLELFLLIGLVFFFWACARLGSKGNSGVAFLFGWFLGRSGR